MPTAALSHETPPASPMHPATYEEVLATSEPGDTIATTKEEEWVTRKKSEVTTTRQIATRVKRELVLEDGRILTDSGPKISTSVNEDTHTTNYQQTEHRVPEDQHGKEKAALGDCVDGVIGALPGELPGFSNELAPADAKVLVSSRVVANPDGKVRESKDRRVLTRNVVERVKETEEKFHRGDTTHDETYYIPSRKVGEKTYIPAQAKLPTRYRNQLRVLKKSGVVKPLPTSGTSSDTYTYDDTIPGSSTDISSEQGDEYKLWLKFNKEPWIEILDKWNQTRKYRLAFIAEEKNTIQDILTEWPSLKMSLGYKLVEADFDAMHPNCELNLFKNWPLFMEKARPIFNNLKSADVNLLEEQLQDDARDYIFFKLMSYKMPPTVKVPIKENGKKRFYKPSIVESQNSFILHVTALIAAVQETPEEDIRDALKAQTDHHLALVPRGPKVLRDTITYNTTINTDDTEELRALRPDGTIVTETRHTKEQEQLCDEELSKNEARSLASDASLVDEKGGTERRKREDLERTTDYMAGGRRVATHVHSRTRTEEAEREGQPNMDDDWDSLSVRMRRQRRLRQADHDKDYKRPLDFDVEEETRKKETSKWLESHFGSESRSSHDSIAEEIGRRPDPYYVKKADDEEYYGKTAAPPPPVYGDRVLRKTKSSTPSDERPAPVVNRTGGYFKGVADWSQRRASKPIMPEPRSSSPSPPAVRSYNSDDQLNGSSPRHVYGKRDSPQGRTSPIGRRHPPSRDDSAYVSSSTMHSPPRGSPFRPLEVDRSFREPSVEDDYRPPVAPERKRHLKQQQRLSEENRYDSGYRSSSRNENSGRSRDSREEGTTEPPPDYSPPRERRGSSDRDRTPPRRRERDERKQNQKTRFAENSRRPSPARKSVGSAIGNSIRKLVGKIRSASAERRARWRTSRSPSPEHSSRTYRQYGGEIAPPAAPPHRYYLGEDPFAPSIYGREHKYEGSSRRAANNDTRDHRDRVQFSSTLGRFSHSTSRLNPNNEPEEDYTRSAQTLPRKLHERKEKSTEKPSSNKYWHRLTPSKRSSSAVNVSHVTTSPDVKVNGYPPGPAKPARTYKALNRSKSFAMGAPEQETHPRYISGMNRNYSTMYKSNPHLSRLDETPEQLKSPGIVSIINRSQRDLADAVSRETERRRDGLFGARYGKTTPLTNGHSNGYSKSYDDPDKKKIFLKGLRERAPDLYQTLHAKDESDGSRLSSRYTPSPQYKERISEERKIPVYKTESLNRETSPFVSRLETRLKSPAIRRGSNSSDNYSETYRYTTRSGDPERPSVTDTVETVSKKIVPSRDGRSKEIIESREVNSVTKSRGYKGEPLSNVKYIENGIRSSPVGYESKNGYTTERRRSNYRVMEKIRDY